MRSFSGFIKVFLSFVIFLWFVKISYAAEEIAETDKLLYEASSFSNLEKQLTMIVGSNVNNQAIQKYGLIFLTVALDRHKEYVPEFVNRYKSYPRPMQIVVAQALAEVRGQGILSELKEKDVITIPHSIIKSVNELSFINKDPDNYNEEDEKYNCIVVDSLILAFHASGDEKYLVKIMKFLSDWPVPVRQLAWEMLNKDMQVSAKQGDSDKQEAGDYKDILDALETTRLANKFQLLTYKIVLWAIESNREQHKDVKEKIERIKRNNPDLDYSKDVKL